jgi:hypothetical protein
VLNSADSSASSTLSQSSQAIPDLVPLVRFLLEPFLESHESLKVDCEVSASRSKVWVRVAFDGEDKGRVFGRGGRNIQAVRTVLEAVAQLSGYSAYLDVFGGHTEREQESSNASSRSRPRSRSRSRPRPSK